MEEVAKVKEITAAELSDHSDRKEAFEAAVETAIRNYINSRLLRCEKLKKYNVEELKSLFFMPSTIELKACDSSNVASYGYSEGSQTLAVTFKGGPTQYRYLGVPKAVFEVLNQSDSKGRSIAEIKVRYACIKWS
jgi:hypothetical protein